MRPRPNSALLIVDVQRDFCPGGALPAPGGDLIVPAINRHITEAQQSGTPIYASRDWHPAITTHFKPYGGEWPPHCVQSTEGAQFHPDLRLPPEAIIVSKGDEPDRPGYSAFGGKTPWGEPLLAALRERGIESLYVAGLATRSWRQGVGARRASRRTGRDGAWRRRRGHRSAAGRYRSRSSRNACGRRESGR